ncbi:uncharacterized protein At5g01610-like [Cynara cardunculus var. scolymus]|uniref:Uncharacterized protein n=1 Tax=Cynara cardunculus var. scolymus TaxID=59895 RepID=A0A103XDC2_CYNCS|nr:uncharacterized protein At5g01610-like [Cynara cardunculus var. scolymus]KVH88688.1 Protein of unknown function DUF538 [Cynara cardunculus var. scolymus]
MSPITPEIRACAEIITGDDICKEKTKSLLREYDLPDGLLPAEDIEELGYVKDTGFMWVKQKKDIVHKFEKVSKQVSYATEVTGYLEKCKIKKLTGVKSKEVLIWISINEIFVENPTADKVTMKTPTGISKSFPKDAFQA